MIRSANQSGYFEPSFKRIMEKEAYIDPVKLRRQERLQKGKKNIGKSFLPSNYPKSTLNVLFIWFQRSCLFQNLPELEIITEPCLVQSSISPRRQSQKPRTSRRRKISSPILANTALATGK